MKTKGLFPVAGYGTRFLPATKAMPKEMLPILNKPLIQYGVEESAEAGLTDICFVTGRTKRAIEDHFDISFEEQQVHERATKKNGDILFKGGVARSRLTQSLIAL
jgi:UTP--glucose-1-phosphate uridylyltransferase